MPDGRTASLVTAPGRGMTFANDAGPRRNADAPPSPAAAGQPVSFGAGGQDALDGPVGRVPGGDRLRAGGFQPGRVMLVGQPDHALRGAQPVERVAGQQLADDLLARRADPGGLLAAPGRGPHVERDLLRRVVTEIGLLAAGLARVGLDQLPADEELDHRRGQPHVGGLADVLPWHGVQNPVDLGVDVRADLRPRPGGQHERLRGQRPQRLFLRGLEHRGRGGAVQRPARPPPGDFRGPALGPGLHLLQRGELPAPPEAVPDIRHRPLDPGLVAGLDRAGRVDQAAVVCGELGIGPVDLRVIQVGLVHPGLEVVRDQPRRDAAEERERRDVALGPGPLVHHQHRPHEHVPRAREHHHERLHRPQLPGDRVQPAAQLPVIDLRLLTRLGGPRVPHRHLRAAGLLRHVRRHIPAEALHADTQAALIPQPLPDRRHPHPRRQLRGDVVVVHGDRRPGHLPQPGISQLREPAPHQLRPLLLALRRAARDDTRGLGRRDVLPQRLAVHPQALGHLVLRPARMPVHQDLGNVDHVERPPRHRPPAVVADGRKVAPSRWPGPPRHARHPQGELRERGGELRERQPLRPGELRERRHLRASNLDSRQRDGSVSRQKCAGQKGAEPVGLAQVVRICPKHPQ